MRQVPVYLIIGNGRVARHILHYFTLQKISCYHWHRHMPQDQLADVAARATHLLLLIKDDAIESFVANHLSRVKAAIIHFSGSLVTPLAYGAHPLMTFGASLYSFDEYQTIPFVLEDSAPAFSELFPSLPNPHVRITDNDKAKYHAFCVLSGNMSCLLWQKLITEFRETFHWPPDIAKPYLRRQMLNLLEDPEHALTGPLARHDHRTLQRNIDALQGDAFQAVYQSFVECYEKITGKQHVS